MNHEREIFTTMAEMIAALSASTTVYTDCAVASTRYARHVSDFTTIAEMIAALAQKGFEV